MLQLCGAVGVVRVTTVPFVIRAGPQAVPVPNMPPTLPIAGGFPRYQPTDPMTNSAHLLIQRAALLAVAVLLSLPLATPALAQGQPHRAERKAQRVERFADALALTDAQKQIVVDAEAEPGALWNLAASLTPTLSDEQKEKLFIRPERPNVAQRDGKRGRRGDRMRGERSDNSDRAERRKEARDAMRSALNLTDAQVAELDALREARKAERQQRIEGRQLGELPGDLAAVLTPAQQEVFKVHRALAMRMYHGRHRRGGYRGR